MNDCMFSSKTDLWATPQDFFDTLDAEFHFTLDACAIQSNAKCTKYYSPKQDGLAQPWGGTVYCNPPYGRTIGQWVEKAAKSAEEGATVVMLLPARTDTKWFHRFIYGKSRDPVHIRPAQIWRGKEQCTLPVHGRRIPRR